MENNGQRSRAISGPRPQIYVHLEFGVSWSQKHIPNNHQATYRSKALKHREAQFLRQTPTPSAGHWRSSAQPPPQYQQHEYRHHPPHPQQQQQQHAANPHYTNSHYHQSLSVPQQHYQARHQQPRMQRWQQAEQAHGFRPLQTRSSYSPPHRSVSGDAADPRIESARAPGDDRRSSRASRASHERGRSAPPPTNDGPWDVASLEGSGLPPASVQLVGSRDCEPPIWKDLPASPANFRLGEASMPWSWSWPIEYGIDVENDEPRQFPSSAAADPRNDKPGHTVNVTASTQNASTSSLPSHRDGSQLRKHGDKPKNPRELESLSAAMMTVDNGFESQWWNTGNQEEPARSPPRPAPLAPARADTRDSLGWAIADEDFLDASFVSPENTMAWSARNQIISPVSTFASPVPTFQPLGRTMSTRSEELFMAGDFWR